MVSLQPLPENFSDLSDDDVFTEILRRRNLGEDYNSPLGNLCERWRRPALYVIRRIQASYRSGSPDDQVELFQDAVRKLIEKGLEQYRTAEEAPERSASPKTFFLRIVKHVAIDYYRRAHEVLAPAPRDDDDDIREPMHEVAQAQQVAKRTEQQADAREVYWTAFEWLKSEHPNEASAWDLYHHQDVEDHEECARLLSISVANSYKRVSRAQAYLKKFLLELAEDRSKS